MKEPKKPAKEHSSEPKEQTTQERPTKEQKDEGQPKK